METVQRLGRMKREEMKNEERGELMERVKRSECSLKVKRGGRMERATME